MLLAAADKPADGQPAADAGLVAPDQLNDSTARCKRPPATSQARATAKPARRPGAASAEAPAPAAPAVARSKEDSTLDKTSLIGKIFIAFGALLTMASAARMFMA